MSEPKIPQQYPYVIEVNAGKYAWCSCGQSKNQPFCDGSHRQGEFKPVTVEIPDKKTVAWCGCKHTKNPPFCDGTHSKL